MSHAKHTVLKLNNFLPYRLSVLTNRISRAISKLYQERFSLTIPEWRVMAVLGEENHLSAARIAERVAMDKVAVSRAVKNLLAKDYIMRQFSTDDRRRSIISLSTKGQDIYTQIVPLAQSVEQTILDQMTAKERVALRKIIDTLDTIQLHTSENPAPKKAKKRS